MFAKPFAFIALVLLLTACQTTKGPTWLPMNSSQSSNLDRDSFECDRDVTLMNKGEEKKSTGSTGGDLAAAFSNAAIEAKKKLQMEKCMNGRGWQKAPD